MKPWLALAALVGGMAFVILSYVFPTAGRGGWTEEKQRALQQAGQRYQAAEFAQATAGSKQAAQDHGHSHDVEGPPVDLATAQREYEALAAELATAQSRRGYWGQAAFYLGLVLLLGGLIAGMSAYGEGG